jgi:hypothetical protein
MIFRQNYRANFSKKPNENIVWLLAFCLFFGKINAQNHLADSLLLLIKTDKRDSNRVNWLNNLAWEIKETDEKTAEKYLTESIDLAKKIEFQKGESQAWNSLGLLKEMAESVENQDIKC